MPAAYVKSIAKEKHKDVRTIEAKWDEAKKRAAEQGHRGNWAYITAIFKNMAHVKD